jgi:Ca2+-binding EF-hand superfamily protein
MRRLSLAWIGFLVGVSVVIAQEKPRRSEGAKRFDPARMLEQFDHNKDGVLEATELPERMKDRFGQMDLNQDGKLNKEELQKAAGRAGKQPAARAAETSDVLFRALDANADGKLSQEELKNAADVLKKLDRNKDGAIERGEVLATSGKGGGRPGEVITPAAKEERHQDQLKVGDLAPDFTLPDPTGKKQVSLSSFRGKKPVVLVFASYT